ncbi:hypothetical protein GJ744_003159 [Endocarpon pusillum]|uniref:Uncharacterized protein n=1 Tax=Endocarpon pusillum TaxID=364733 RepID=A0A8H7ARX3_9EURO|nr:hypothetical protein GJ744_003159 [Endocarpon pusillum]
MDTFEPYPQESSHLLIGGSCGILEESEEAGRWDAREDVGSIGEKKSEPFAPAEHERILSPAMHLY